MPRVKSRIVSRHYATPHSYDVVVYTDNNHYYAKDSRGNLICVDSQTACILESINYIINNKGSGSLLIKGGTYIITKEILVDDGNNYRNYGITIIGERGAKIKTDNPTSPLGWMPSIFHFASRGGIKEINIIGLDLSLEDSTRSFQNLIAIELLGNAFVPQVWKIKIKDNVIISNYQINNTKSHTHGIIIHSRTKGEYDPVPVDFDVLIENNKVINTSSGIIVANYSKQGPASGRIIIRNNYVDTKWDTHAPADCIFVFSNGKPKDLSYYIPDVIIEGNTALNPGDVAIEVANVKNIIIKGNTANGTIHLSYNWINGIVEGNTIYAKPGVSIWLGAYASGKDVAYIRNTLIKGNSLYGAALGVNLDLSQLSSPIDIGPIKIVNNNILIEGITLNGDIHVIKIWSGNWSNYPPVLIMGNSIRLNNVNANGKGVTGIAYAAPRATVTIAYNNLVFTNVSNASLIRGIEINNGYPGRIYGNSVIGSTQWLRLYFWGPYYVFDNYTDNSNIDVDPGIRIVFRRNIGYETEKSDVVTIPTGSTSVTVNHGLKCTPRKILVSPLAQPPGSIWVSNITATQFTINTSTAPTSDLPVAWYAEC